MSLNPTDSAISVTVSAIAEPLVSANQSSMLQIDMASFKSNRPFPVITLVSRAA